MRWMRACVSVSFAFRENRATYVWTLKDKAVASRHHADLHVERVPFAVELCDAAERMHDLHLLQCQKAAMSQLKMSMREIDAVHHTFVLGFMTPTPCLLMTTQTWFGQLGSNVCCNGACGQSHQRHTVSFRKIFLVLLTYFNVKEGAAESWPCCNGFQEHDFGLLHCDAALLVVGVDDVLQDEGKLNVKCTLQMVHVYSTGCIFINLPFTVFQSSPVMILIWSAGTRSSSILGISSNRVLSESTKALKSSPPRSVMSSLVQLW